MSKLDTDRFRKVLALVTDGATHGERTAAEARATEMAAKAGLTLAEAVALSNSHGSVGMNDPLDKWRSFFDDLFSDPEYRREHEEREREKAAKRAQLLMEYGSEEAIFAETPREELLSAAVEHLKTWEE